MECGATPKGRKELMAKKKTERRKFTDDQKRKHVERVDAIKAKGGSVMDYYDKYELSSGSVSQWREKFNGTNPPAKKTRQTQRRKATHIPRGIDLATQVTQLEEERNTYRDALVQVQGELRQALGR